MLKMERHIDIDRFDYDLPDERIAKYPLEERSASKLLVYERGEISERRFRDIGDILPEGTLLNQEKENAACLGAAGDLVSQHQPGEDQCPAQQLPQRSIAVDLE